jgi:hypothetical protein
MAEREERGDFEFSRAVLVMKGENDGDGNQEAEGGIEHQD